MIVRFLPLSILIGCAPSIETGEQEIASDEDIESSWKDEEEDSCVFGIGKIEIIENRFI